MRTILGISFVLVLAFGVAPSASAAHAGDSCTFSGPFATGVVGGNCIIELACPGTAACLWELKVEGSGIGEVRARIVQPPAGPVITSCGPELLECSASAPYNLPPSSSVDLHCAINGGAVIPLLQPTLTCTATAAGHVG